ncbi:cold shock and DUF1294 domain-containing protein [Salinibacterium sp. ZJ77]|uniref:DUF1294 domain-containing protein n=1 Tax=Salinibacterium sp. ZJ77 TaxID=2708337 RepID=UPI0014204693|nr:cold shock and DUF1294 domain-containing protein [Salinibacterium sp. ZJ77]
MKPGPVRMTGVLTAWNDGRGFGFIAPTLGGTDIFVHVSAFPEGSERPAVGDEIDYVLQLSPDGRPRAASARLQRRAPVPARVRRAVPPPRSSPFGYLSILAFGCIVLISSQLAPVPLWVFVLYGGASLVAFIAYAVDKRAAQLQAWRVEEGSLLALGLIGGWPGAILAQQVFRHKTLKVSFQRMFWVTVVLNVLGFVVLSWIARVTEIV